MTLVVLHPADENPGWKAWIEGITEPVEVPTLTDLNGTIRDLGLTMTLLLGARPCTTANCPYAATAAIMTASPDSFMFIQCCDDHRPPEIPEDWHLLEGIIPARAAYSRYSGSDLADLTRDLIDIEVPAEAFPQPACRSCNRRLMPSITPDALTWTDTTDIGRCGRRAAHRPADNSIVRAVAAHARYLIDGEPPLTDELPLAS